jgi:hypothetical protein
LFSFFLPLILVSAIIYGILLKTDIFPDKKLNLALSIVMGLMATQFALTAQCMEALLPRAVLVLTVGLIGFILLSLLVELKNIHPGIRYFMMVLTILALVLVFLKAAEACGIWTPILWIAAAIAAIAPLIKKLAEPKKPKKEESKPTKKEEPKPYPIQYPNK